MMWAFGMVMMLVGIAHVAYGAVPRDIYDPNADGAIRRGAWMVPAGLALMFARSVYENAGVPRTVLGLYVVASALLGALVIARFSEDNAPPLDEKDAASRSEKAAARIKAS